MQQTEEAVLIDCCSALTSICRIAPVHASVVKMRPLWLHALHSLADRPAALTATPLTSAATNDSSAPSLSAVALEAARSVASCHLVQQGVNSTTDAPAAYRPRALDEHFQQQAAPRGILVLTLKQTELHEVL